MHPILEQSRRRLLQLKRSFATIIGYVALSLLIFVMLAIMFALLFSAGSTAPRSSLEHGSAIESFSLIPGPTQPDMFIPMVLPQAMAVVESIEARFPSQKSIEARFPIQKSIEARFPSQKPGFPLWKVFESDNDLQDSILSGEAERPYSLGYLVAPCNTSALPCVSAYTRNGCPRSNNRTCTRLHSATDYQAFVPLYSGFIEKEIKMAFWTYPETYCQPPNCGGSSNNNNQEGVALMWMLIGPIMLVSAFMFTIPTICVLCTIDLQAKRYFEKLGLSKVNYWAGNLVVDASIHIVLSLLLILIALAAGMSPLTSQIGPLIVILLIYSFVAPFFGYVISFAFKSPLPAYLMSLLIVFGVFGITTLPSFMLPLVSSSSQPGNGGPVGLAVFNTTMAVILDYGAGALSPMAALMGPLMLMGATPERTAFSSPLWWGAILVMLVHAVLVIGALILAEHVRLFGCRRAPKRSILNDNDVESSQSSLLHVKNLKKTFKGGKVALDGVDLVVPRNCGTFTMLGPNGAGKTTLFSIISGDVLPTEGTASINGNECFFDRHAVWKNTSFVEQFDVSYCIKSVFLNLKFDHFKG